MDNNQQDANKKFPLTYEEAKDRKKCLSNPTDESYNVNYDVSLTIRHSEEKDDKDPKRSFEGVVKITFDYFVNNNKNELFLNFWGEVDSVKVNGEKVTTRYENKRIYINDTLLKKGSSSKNEISVVFQGIYSKRGQGLHHFIDPSDKNEYLYTQFEPFDCHLLFPCFDQPDLKSTLKLIVLARKNWAVLGNERELSNEESSKFDHDKHNLDKTEFNFLTKNVQGKDYSVHVFDKTPRISTYLFAVCAGNYYSVDNPIDYHIPMKVYKRESMRGYGDDREFFRVTIAGMEFYKKYFGVEFPYTKYDQIYTPEYNWGAMENVGLVTYNECYCTKDPASELLRCRWCITVLHELAHQWFGNLVTMKWWNDLWLNESFATFISFLCQEKADNMENYRDVWLRFYLSKGAAYKEDQCSTTHPIYSDIINTEVAETHFDGIVYYKGSSFLKQLYYFIGYENFSKGLTDYFSTYAWQNTEFDQFLNKLIDAVKKDDSFDKNIDLNQICNSWLKKAGLTQMELEWNSDSNGNLESLNVIQTAVLKEHNNLQTHKCNLLFVYDDENRVLEGQIILPQEVTKITNSNFVGKKAPKAIILNEGDHGYFKCIFDNTSINYLKENLFNSNVDNMTRQLYYRGLFDMAKDSRISAIEYMDILTNMLNTEVDYQLITINLRFLAGMINNYIPLDYFPKYSNKLFDTVLSLIQKFNTEKEYVMNFLDLLLTFAYSDEHYDFLKTWLDGEAYVVVNGVKTVFDSKLLNQEKRFSIVKGVFKNQNISKEEKDKLLEKEVLLDNNSNKSISAKFACYASLPDSEIKKELWNKYVNQSNSESLPNMKSSMAHFSSYRQLNLTKDYLIEKFFTDVIKIGTDNEHFYISHFIDCFAPTQFVSKEIINRVDQLVVKTVENKLLNKILAELKDDMIRFLKAHELCLKYQSK